MTVEGATAVIWGPGTPPPPPPEPPLPPQPENPAARTATANVANEQRLMACSWYKTRKKKIDVPAGSATRVYTVPAGRTKCGRICVGRSIRVQRGSRVRAGGRLQLIQEQTLVAYRIQ